MSMVVCGCVYVHSLWVLQYFMTLDVRNFKGGLCSGETKRATELTWLPTVCSDRWLDIRFHVAVEAPRSHWKLANESTSLFAYLYIFPYVVGCVCMGIVIRKCANWPPQATWRRRDPSTSDGSVRVVHQTVLFQSGSMSAGALVWLQVYGEK